MDAKLRLEKKSEGLAVLHERSSRPQEARIRPSENFLYFDAVARHGSIRRAAETLHIASSALNRRILDLEEEVGSALFERLPRGVRLSAAGEMLLTYVRSSLRELRKVETQIDQLQGQMRGIVRIAVAESVTPSLLPEAIAAYQQEHPGVGFHAIVDGPELLLTALVRDNVDLILTHQPPRKTAVSVLSVAVHPLCVLVSPSHPLANRKSLLLSDCIGYPLAFPDHTLAVRNVLDRAIEEAALNLEPAFESDSIETLKAFARLGHALCFCFHLGSKAETHGLVAVPLRDPHCAEARLYLAARRGRVLPVAAASFAEELQNTLNSRVSSRSISVA